MLAAHRARGQPVSGAQEDEPLLTLIKRTYFDLVQAFERRVGMSAPRLQVVLQLRRGGELSQAELQQRLRVDGAAVTRQVKQLEEEGLVTRRADPEDNRFTLVALTPAGQRLADELLRERDRFDALVTAGLSDEQIAVVRQCLRRLRENARALGEERREETGA